LVGGGDGEDRNVTAWELVRQVRRSAGELCPIVNEATAGLMDLYEDDELILDDPALSRALTVMTGVLSSMQTSIKILSWLEPAAVVKGGVLLALPTPDVDGDG
jgi:hypothetical protein